MKRGKILSGVLFAYCALTILLAVIPFLVVLVMSISTEADVAQYGFSMIPKNFTVTAYKTLFENSERLVRTALWTLFIALVAPLISCVVNSLAAYPLSRPDFKLKGIYGKYLIYTMLFGAGMLPTYIVNTRYYQLYDNPLIFFVGGASAWTIFLYRTFFKEVPQEMIEAAQIDGASEFKILWKIMLPTAKSIFAMQYTLGFIASWNGSDTSLYYIQNPDFYELQYYLNKILKDIQFLKTSLEQYGASGADFPTTTIQYAILIFSLIPIFVLFPFMSKYFTKGMAAGAVKG